MRPLRRQERRARRPKWCRSSKPCATPCTIPILSSIARTDAIAVEGFDAAIDRAAAYLEAGADMIFVEAPTSEAEIAEIAKRLPG